jgi:hypothetical protein
MATRKPAPAKRLSAHLGSEDGAAALVGLAFDHAMAQPVSAWIEVDRVLAAVDLATTPAAIERFVDLHVRPGVERARARAKGQKHAVGAYLSAEMQAELRSLAARPVTLDEQFVKHIVEQDSVRHMLRSVVEETLDRFINAFKPGGSGGGVAGAVGRSAFGFARKAGGGILGGIAGQIEDQLKRSAGSFMQNSMGALATRTAAILASPEMAQRMGRTNVAAFDALMKMAVADVARFSDQLDVADLLDAVPDQVRHLLAREDVRAGLRAEVEAALAVEGAQPVSALFADAAHLAAARADVVAMAGPILGDFAGTEGFQGWLTTALA